MPNPEAQWLGTPDEPILRAPTPLDAISSFEQKIPLLRWLKEHPEIIDALSMGAAGIPGGKGGGPRPKFRYGPEGLREVPLKSSKEVPAAPTPGKPKRGGSAHSRFIKPSTPEVTPGEEIQQQPQPAAAPSRRGKTPASFINRIAELSKTAPDVQEWASEKGGVFDRLANQVARRFAKPTLGNVEPNVSRPELRQEGLRSITEHLPKYDPQKGDFSKFAYEQLKRDVGRFSTGARKPTSGVGEATPREREMWRTFDAFKNKFGYKPSPEFVYMKLKRTLPEKAYTLDEVREIMHGKVTPPKASEGGTTEGEFTGGKRAVEGRSIGRKGGRLHDTTGTGAGSFSSTAQDYGVAARKEPPRLPHEGLLHVENPLDKALRKELYNQQIKSLDSAMKGLTSEQRAVLTMYQTNVPVEQQASALGMSKSLYQKRVKEVMDQLQNAIKEPPGPKSVGAAAGEEPPRNYGMKPSPDAKRAYDQIKRNEESQVFKSVEDYNRFVNKGDPREVEPDPNIARQLKNPKQYTKSAPGLEIDEYEALRNRSGGTDMITSRTGGINPQSQEHGGIHWARPSVRETQEQALYALMDYLRRSRPGLDARSIKMPATKGGLPMMDFKD